MSQPAVRVSEALAPQSMGPGQGQRILSHEAAPAPLLLLGEGERKARPPMPADRRALYPWDCAGCFSQPRYLPASSAWGAHVPMAMFLVEALRPRLLVELGTYTGCSYCAFCQAVDDLKLNTTCCAVDTWQGDMHCGHYGDEVLRDLRAHHDPLYGHFSSLIQSTFDDALDYFADCSIDLLHIDGCHTYEAARHDFESWLPKLSKSAVVLLHDTAVRGNGFGVHKLWAELKEEYPWYESHFGYGLGLLAVGACPPPVVRRLCEASEEEVTAYHRLFSTLGSLATTRGQCQRQDAETGALKSQVRELEVRNANLASAANAQRALAEVQQKRLAGLHAELQDKTRAFLDLQEAARALEQDKGRAFLNLQEMARALEHGQEVQRTRDAQREETTRALLQQMESKNSECDALRAERSAAEDRLRAERSAAEDRLRAERSAAEERERQLASSAEAKDHQLAALRRETEGQAKTHSHQLGTLRRELEEQAKAHSHQLAALQRQLEEQAKAHANLLAEHDRMREGFQASLAGAHEELVSLKAQLTGKSQEQCALAQTLALKDRELQEKDTQAVCLASQVEQFRDRLLFLEQEKQAVERQLGSALAASGELARELQTLTGTVSWAVARRLRKLRLLFCPANTLRERAYRRGIRAVRGWRRAGTVIQ